MVTTNPERDDDKKSTLVINGRFEFVPMMTLVTKPTDTIERIKLLLYRTNWRTECTMSPIATLKHEYGFVGRGCISSSADDVDG